MKNTAVVILNYNGIGFLKQFLNIVIENTPEADVIVIDNYSSDESLLWLEENFPRTLVIRNPKNYGFAGGYNHGLQSLEYENFVLLNSDVEVTPNWLSPILHRANQNPNVVAIQPKLLDFNERQKFEYAGAAGGFLDKYGYAFCRGRVFDSIENDEGQYQESIDIFWATGACFFIKAKVFKQLGGFEERFFAHMEEIDLCWRIHNAGYKIQYEPNSVVYHVGGGTLHKSNPFKTYLNYRNNLAMLFKNLPAKQLFPVIFIRLVLDGLSSVKFLKEGNLRDIFAILKAHFAFYAMIPYLWNKRKGPFLGAEKLNNFSVVWRYFGKKTKNLSRIMLKVGITGGIGTGKSTVAKVFSLLGVPVYESDQRAKWLIENDLQIVSEIKDLLGDAAYHSDGKYKRSFVAAAVFQNQSLLSSLNRIVHPRVAKDFDDWTSSQKTKYALKEAAIMNKNSGLDKIIVVVSPMDIRISRLLKRDVSKNREDFKKIMANQKTDKDFLEMADFIVENDDDSLLIPQVLKIHQTLIS